MKGRRARQRGIALLLVLWVFMLLGVIALDFSSYMRDDAMAAVNLADGTRGYYVALAGMNRAMLDWVRYREHEAQVVTLVQSGADVPNQDDDQALVPPDGAWHEGDFHGAKWSVRMTDEQSRVPINALCLAAQAGTTVPVTPTPGQPNAQHPNPAQAQQQVTSTGPLEPTVQALLTTLVRYVVAGGGNAHGTGTHETAEVETIVDSILDWCDPDNLRRSHGAENAYYQKRNPPYLAKNGLFDSPDELLLVRGVTPEVYYGTEGNIGLRDLFSFYVRNPNGFRLNMRYISPKVMEALFGGPDAASAHTNDAQGDSVAMLDVVKDHLNTISPGLGFMLVDQQPTYVVIEARGDTTEERNQSRIAAVAELGGGQHQQGELPHIKRWFDRAPWEGVLPSAPTDQDQQDGAS